MAEKEAETISRKERKTALLNQLKDLTAEIVTDGDKLKMFAEKWRSGFWSYSLSNLFLIWFQKPDFTLVSGFRHWKKVGRYVRKGEKAIWIFAPMLKKVVLKKILDEDDEEEKEEKKFITGFIPVCVFDYSQTDGKELEIGNTEIVGCSNLTVENICKAFDIPLEWTQGIHDGVTDGKKVKVSKRKNKAQEICGCLHEVAHIQLGHFTDRRKKLKREEREIEAESVSYIVSSCIGIQNEGAKKYIGHWKGDGKKIKEHSVKIVACADKMLRRLNPLLSKAEITVKGEGSQSSLPF